MTTATEPELRQHLVDLLAELTPFDDLEAEHLGEAVRWAVSGAPLYRTQGGHPDPHLVSYFVPLTADGTTGEPRALLGRHRRASLLLPPGGHVEHETPWQAVEREAREELRLDAVPHPAVGPVLLFVTLTPVNSSPRHRDLSLWHVLAAAPEHLWWFDPGEYSGVELLTLQQILDTPLSALDPHQHRFARKLVAALPSWAGRAGGGCDGRA